MRVIFIAILLSLSINALGRIGLADWTETTPKGNEINNFIDYSLYLKNGTQLDGLLDWYFYKNKVIGRIRGDHFADTAGYFIVDEVTYKIDTFKSEAEWHKYLDENKLQPKVWTRWYAHDWTLLDDRILWVLFLGFYVTIPLLIFLLFITFKALFKEKLNFRRPYTIILMAFITLVLIKKIFEWFPQSI